MFSRCFSFVKCKYKSVQSSSAPGLPVLHLLRRRCRLTSVAKAAVIQCLCFPWTVCDHHFITDSILHISTLFLWLIFISSWSHHSSNTWSFVSCLFVRCGNFFLFFFPFRYVCPSCNIMLWYSVLYRAVVEGRAGQGTAGQGYSR